MIRKKDKGDIIKHSELIRVQMEECFEKIRPDLLDIARNIYPPAIRGLNFKADADKGDTGYELSRASDYHLYDIHPVNAHRRGAAGFHANLTSPARRWFKFGLLDLSFDPGNAQAATDLQNYLDKMTDCCAWLLYYSGTYNQLAKLYEHLLAFGFGCLFVTEDETKVISATCLRMGTYALGIGANGKVNRLVRRFTWTAAQIKERFGEDNTPENILNEANTPKSTKRWCIYNLVEPNYFGEFPADDFTDMYNLDKSMVYRSLYWIPSEKGDNKTKGILQATGFKFCPIIAPRMDKEAGDIYGVGRGHEALGMVKALQAVSADAFTLCGNVAMPPVVATSDFFDTGVTLSRGGVNYTKQQGDGAITPVFPQMASGIQVCDFEIKNLKQGISESFYNDLFATINAMKDNPRMTAFEVDQRVREGLTLLGPVLTGLDTELLDPLVGIVRFYAEQFKLLQVPKSLESAMSTIRIEYVSSVHLAQKSAELGALERFLNFMGAVSQGNPSAFLNLNADKSVREYARTLGIPEACMATPDEVDKSRKQAEEAQQEQIKQQQMNDQLKAAAAAGAVKTEKTVAGQLMGTPS